MENKAAAQKRIINMLGTKMAVPPRRTERNTPAKVPAERRMVKPTMSLSRSIFIINPYKRSNKLFAKIAIFLKFAK